MVSHPRLFGQHGGFAIRNFPTQKVRSVLRLSMGSDALLDLMRMPVVPAAISEYGAA